MLRETISLSVLVRRFWKKTLLTWVLVVLEGVSLVLMPLVIGRAVDGMMSQSLTGIIELSGLCLLALVVGAGRRFYDTRAYSKIYRTTANEMVRAEQQRQTSLSKISARVSLLTEFVEFLEDSIPAVIHQAISLIGTIAIIVFISWKVFVACLVCLGAATIVYGVSKTKIFRLNRGANDELERQVDVLETASPERISKHFQRLMGWRIRLSDLETLNYSLIWVALAGMLIFTVVTVASSGVATFGEILATVMYVFGFIESVLAFPLHYEQLVRLQEITTRLSGAPSS